LRDRQFELAQTSRQVGTVPLVRNPQEKPDLVVDAEIIGAVLFRLSADDRAHDSLFVISDD
jgi:hypothetical protein